MTDQLPHIIYRFKAHVEIRKEFKSFAIALRDIQARRNAVEQIDSPFGIERKDNGAPVVFSMHQAWQNRDLLIRAGVAAPLLTYALLDGLTIDAADYLGQWDGLSVFYARDSKCHFITDDGGKVIAEYRRANDNEGTFNYHSINPGRNIVRLGALPNHLLGNAVSSIALRDHFLVKMHEAVAASKRDTGFVMRYIDGSKVDADYLKQISPLISECADIEKQIHIDELEEFASSSPR